MKETAKTLNFPTDHGLTDYDELAAKTEEAGVKFDTLSDRWKQIEGHLGEVATLKTHSKTRDIYAEFKKFRHKKEFRADHERELATHEAARGAFRFYDEEGLTNRVTNSSHPKRCNTVSPLQRGGAFLSRLVGRSTYVSI